MVAGIATTPSLLHSPSIFRSIPVSRFVARIFIPSLPAIIRIEDNTCKEEFFFSANRAAVYTASENLFVSIEIFIHSLLGLLVVGIERKDYVCDTYSHYSQQYILLIRYVKWSYK